MLMLNLIGNEPIYEQITNQIIKLIELEVLSENDKLPSVRKLALDLSVNPNTVAKAYAKLEKDGYIYTISKKGAFVASVKYNKQKILMENLKKDLLYCYEAKVSEAKIIALLKTIYGGKNDAEH